MTSIALALWALAATSTVRADGPEEVPESEFSSANPETHRLRTAVEMGSAMAFGTMWYVMYLDFNLPDWDYPSVTARLDGSAVRFDTNSLYTNAFAHPLVGSAYYGLARVNGLGPFEAFLVAFATSSFWEFVPEYREYVSFNDLVFTPFGGMAIGEVLFNLSDYFHSAPRGSWVHRFLEHTIGLPRSIHYALDGDPRPGAGHPEDALGLSSAYWHRFHVYLQMTGATDAKSESSDRWYGLEIATELVAVPGHLQPGRFAGPFTRGEFTDFMLRLSTTGDAAGDARAHAGAMLAGWLAQDLHGEPGLRLDGWALAAGFATAIDYRDWVIGGQRDTIGTAHLGGLGVDMHVALGHFGWARLRGHAYLDFAAVRSLAIDRWRELNGDSVVLKNVLDIRDYYYGYGASTWLSLGVEVSGLELEASLRWGQWRSIQGMNRAPERVTADAPSSDEMTEYELSGSYGPRGHPFRIGLSVGGVARWGRLDGLIVRRRQSFATIEVGMRF